MVWTWRRPWVNLQTSATFVSAERKGKGLDSGADGYLAQPVEAVDLSSRA